MSSGAKQTLTLAKETTPGVAPTPLNGKDYLFTTTDLGRTVNTETSDMIGRGDVSRLSQGSVTLGVDVGGNIEGELMAGLYDDLLSAAFCNDWATDVLEIGGELKTFTAVRGFEDVSEYAVFNGVAVNEFTLSLDNRAKATVSFGLMGMDYKRETTDPRGKRTPPIEKPFMSSLSVGKIKVNGVELNGKACVKSLDFTLNNNIEGEDCLGSGKLGPARLTLKGMDITGNLTLAWNKEGADIIDRSVSRETIAIEWPITDTLGNSYTFTLPFVEVNGDLPSGGKEDIMEATVEYAAVKEGVKITRVTV